MPRPSRRTHRAQPGHRTCQDCAGVYRVGAGDPRWCPACVTTHTGRCRDCGTLFDLDGYHRQCPSCRDQIGLFPAIAGHFVQDKSRGGGR